MRLLKLRLMENNDKIDLMFCDVIDNSQDTRIKRSLLLQVQHRCDIYLLSVYILEGNPKETPYWKVIRKRHLPLSIDSQIYKFTY